MSFLINPYWFEAANCTYSSGTTFTDWTLDGHDGNYNIDSGALVADMPASTTENGDNGYYDIGTANISETAWLLRWKWSITGAIHTSGAVALVQVGLFSGSEAAGTSGSIDGTYSSTQGLASIFTSITGSDTEYFQACTASAGSAAYTGTTRANLSEDFAYPASFYFQIKRHQPSSVDTLTYTFTSNPDYVTDVSTVTVTDATGGGGYMPSSLRYLKVESLQPFSPANNALSTTIEDFKFNNDTDVPC